MKECAGIAIERDEVSLVRNRIAVLSCSSVSSRPEESKYPTPTASYSDTRLFRLCLTMGGFAKVQSLVTRQ